MKRETFSYRQRTTTYGLGYCLLMIVLFLPVSASAQGPQFSQFYAAPLTLSPSFAGSTHGSRMVMNYRNQWPSLPRAFVT